MPRIRRALALLWAIPLGYILVLAGCAHQQTRFQSEEEGDRERTADVKTIGDVTSVAGADPVPVMGVGLVVGLDGTGGGAPSGGHRSWLEADLRKRSVENPKAVLASPNGALVIVTAWIPPGTRKDDPLDLEVSLPPQSKATSLRGGYLRECQLYNFDSAKNLDPDYTGPDRTLKGHPVVRAQGPLLVGMGDGDERGRLRQGRIWGGGRSKIDRPFYLYLNENRQFARMSQTIAERINETLNGPMRAGMNDLAVTKNRAVVYLRVPAQYALNQQRFLRVARLIPLREDVNKLCEDRLTPGGSRGDVAVGAGSAYRKRLEEDLLDPARTVPAALRLEALGADSIPVLKRGLESDHALVRFTSAEALAYLGCPACGEELARLAAQQPALRAFCLTAMASLDEAISHVKLRELLTSPAAEARYGAFRALRALDEREPAIRGELLNDAFWVHRVVPNSSPLVHLSTSRRAEIVFFGEDAYLQAPFSFLSGDFTITASKDDNHCTVSRFSSRHGTSRRQCSLKVEDVVRAVADQGGAYPDVVELLRQAHHCQTLNCAVAVDALPQATSVYDLARAGKNDPNVKTDIEIFEAKADFGSTPTLFESTGRRSRSAFLKNEEAALRDKKLGKAVASSQ